MILSEVIDMGLFNFKKRRIKKRREQLVADAEVFIQVHFVRERSMDKNKYNTLSLKSDPDRDACVEWYENHGNPKSFSEIVMAYLKDSNKDESFICDKCSFEKSFLNKLKNDKNYHPSKGEAVLLAFAFKLNFEETKALLMSAEHSLSNSSKSDLIIRYFIKIGEYNIGHLNYVLDKFCELKIKDIM